MRKAKEDPGLTEVKAVLQELQRLDLPAADNIDQGGSDEIAPGKARKIKAAPSSRAGIAVFDRKRAAMEGRALGRRRWRRLLAGASLLIGGAAVLFATGVVDVPVELKTFLGNLELAALGKRDDYEASLLTEARRLLNEGNVALARTRLLSGGPDKHAELAFMLAQSYDPNYVRTLPKTDSLPDRAEAERWYKKWYELAVSNGLDMDSERLRRIINAMQ